MIDARPNRLLRAGLYLGTWTLVGINRLLGAGIYQAATQGTSLPREEILSTMAAWYGCALVAVPFIRLNRHIPISRSTWRRNLPLHLLACAVFSFVEISLTYLIETWLTTPTPKAFGSYLVTRVSFDFLIYWVVIGIAHAFEYSRRLRERELIASTLEARLAQSQLEVLRMQLQPHFLFNTLHAISALVHRDPAAADRMIAQLSDLLRLSLEARSGQEVTLAQELELLDQYLAIMRTRHADRLKVQRAIAPDTLGVLVPAFVLQPLVENAIRFAVASRVEGGEIRLLALREGSSLTLRILDDGPGLGSTDAPASTGVGLKNTRERLRMIHGERASLALVNLPEGGLEARLSVPWRVASGVHHEETRPLPAGDLHPEEGWGR